MCPLLYSRVTGRFRRFRLPLISQDLFSPVTDKPCLFFFFSCSGYISISTVSLCMQLVLKQIGRQWRSNHPVRHAVHPSGCSCGTSDRETQPFHCVVTHSILRAYLSSLFTLNTSCKVTTFSTIVFEAPIGSSVLTSGVRGFAWELSGTQSASSFTWGNLASCVRLSVALYN